MHRRLAVLAAAASLLAGAAGTAAAEPPDVAAEAVLVGNGANGLVLHAENVRERRAIASITKLMTALVVLDHARPRDVVRVGGPAPTIGEATIGLRRGERLTVRELLTAILVESANDAAWALAFHVGGGSVDRFVELMNEKAAELGLRDTHFSRPDGLDDPGNYSSARDVFRLARVVMRKPLVRELVRIREADVAGRTVDTTNDLLGRYPGLIGVKTGHTNGAGWSQVAAARGGGVTIYAVLLGGPSREQRNADLSRLLDWGLDQYRRVSLVRTNRTYALALVPFSDRRLRLVAAEGAVGVVQVGHPLTERVVARAMVSLPVEAGDLLGTVEVLDGNRILATRDLVAAESIERPSLGQRLRWYAGRALDHAGNVFSFVAGLIT